MQQLGRVQRALVERIAGLDVLPLRDEQPGAPRQLVLDRLERLAVLVRCVGTIVTFGPALGLLDRRPRPPTSASVAAPFGLRASKISTTRGRPCVMSAPATPPVWNVRIVSCVPGSPIDWAAMMPDRVADLGTCSPVARNVP